MDVHFNVTLAMACLCFVFIHDLVFHMCCLFHRSMLPVSLGAVMSFSASIYSIFTEPGKLYVYPFPSV